MRGKIIALLTLVFALTTVQIIPQSDYWSCRMTKGVYTTKESPVLTVNFNDDSKPLIISLFYSKDYKNDVTQYSPVVSEYKHQLKSKGKNTNTVSNVKLPVNKPGYYMANILRGQESRSVVFLISDIAAVAKSIDNETVVWVYNRISNKPLPSARITASGKISSAKSIDVLTDSKGFAQINEPFELLTVSYGDHTAVIYPAINQDYGDENINNGIYVYTDRPVYRPGHKAYIKAIVRDVVKGGYVNKPFTPATVSVSSSYPEAVLMTQEVRTNAQGTISTEFDIPEEASIGEYQVRVQCGENTNRSYFDVIAYRKPEYRLNVKMSQNRVVAGSPLTAEVSAKYYFGGGLKNTKIKWFAYASPTWYYPNFVKTDKTADYNPFNEDENEETQEYDNYGYEWGEIYLEGEAITDANGMAKISLPTTFKNKPFKTPVNLSITISCVDVAGRSKEASANTIILPSSIYTTIQTSEYVYAVNDKVSVQLNTYNMKTEKPVAAGMTIKVKRIEYEQVKGKWTRKEYTVIPSSNVKSDEKGIKQFSFTPVEAGDYVVAVVTRDEKGRTLENDISVWVTPKDRNYSWIYYHKQLDLIVGKRTAKPGDTIKTIIKTSQKKALVWLTIEGQSLFDSRLIPVENGIAVAEIPIKAEYSPNIIIKAGCFINGEYIERAQTVLSPKPELLINVKLATDKTDYRPGETATYSIETTDYNGNPVSAEVSLGVVDESIYAIRSDNSPNIRYYFWGPRNNRVVTARSQATYFKTSVNALVAGSPLKAVKEERMMKAKETRLRKDFRDTAFWNAFIVTGVDGKAEVPITMPDNLTEWRATARAVTEETAVGEQINKFKVNQPLIAQIELPRFAVHGDSFPIIGIIRNSAAKAMTVNVRLELSDNCLATTAPMTKKITVSPSADARLEWQVKASAVGTTYITLYADGNEESDAMEAPLEIQPYANMRLKSVSGTTSNNAAGVIAIPAEALGKGKKLEVHLSPSLLSEVISSVRFLVEYPYGCIEQTTSPLIANLKTMSLLNALDVKDAALLHELDKANKSAIKRIYEKRFYDGGWGWGVNSQSDPYWTAYVYRALLMAQDQYDINPVVIKEAYNFLLQQAMKLKTEFPVKSKYKQSQMWKFEEDLWKAKSNLAVKADILELLTKTNPKALNSAALRLYERKNDLNLTGLLSLRRSLMNVGETQKADSLLNDVRNMAKTTSSTAYWKSSDYQYWRYGIQDTFATADVLLDLINNNPQDPLIDKAVNWLLLNRQGNSWVSTNDTAKIVEAMSAYIKSKSLTSFKGTADVVLNGKTVKTISIDSTSDLFNRHDVAVDANMIMNGENKWELKLNGTGNLNYTIAWQYALPMEQKFLEVNGLRIERLYFKQIKTMKKFGKGKNAYYEQVPAFVSLKDNPKPGDEIAVKLVLSASTNMRHVVIDDPLPAGFEPIDEQDSNYFYYDYLNGGRYYNYDYNYFGYALRQQRDDKMSMLIEDVREGKQVYWYLLRAVTPGDFRAAPTKAYQMYRPLWRGSGASDRVVITR